MSSYSEVNGSTRKDSRKYSEVLNVLYRNKESQFNSKRGCSLTYSSSLGRKLFETNHKMISSIMYNEDESLGALSCKYFLYLTAQMY